MIRRKAALVGTGEAGWCLGWLIRKDANLQETLVYPFESSITQLITEQPQNNIKFTDGQPDPIPVFE